MGENEISIRERLNRMQEALESTHGQDKPSRVEYCTKCDEYAVGYDGPCDHRYEYRVAADWEETTLVGYVQALEWVLKKRQDAGGK